MNFVIIQNEEVEDTYKEPYPIVQMFTDAELIAFALYLQNDVVDNDQVSEGVRKIASTFHELLGQWENRTQ